MGELICDPNEGGFVYEFQNMTIAHNILCSDVDIIPASTYNIYRSKSIYNLASKRELASQV